MNAEGGFIGARPGKAHFLIDLGVTGGISKAADDSVQLIAEALISGATDASTAGSARIVAAAFSGLYLLTRHGRDVTLPRYTDMETTLGRPTVLVSNNQRHSHVLRVSPTSPGGASPSECITQPSNATPIGDGTPGQIQLRLPIEF